MRVLGLDLSLTATGAVVVDGDELAPEDGVRIHRAETFKTRLAGVERLDWIYRQVRELAAPRDAQTAARTPVDLAAIEGYSFGSRFSHQAHLGELGGVIRLGLHRLEVPVVVLAPKEWRKRLLGNGNLAKDDIKLEVFKRYGVELPSTDATEAFAIALAAFRANCGLDQPAPKKRSRRAAIVEGGDR